jgi:hypothetical protein
MRRGRALAGLQLSCGNVRTALALKFEYALYLTTIILTC